MSLNVNRYIILLNSVVLGKKKIIITLVGEESLKIAKLLNDVYKLSATRTANTSRECTAHEHSYDFLLCEKQNIAAFLL